ncbi:MAG TPA: ATP-binding protein [Acidimicrobiales bacterium]
MLRNVKVGTKLLAILAAPLVVIIVLVSIGVRERLTVKDNAARVEQLALLASTTSDYANQLQIESFWAATAAASGGGAGTAELQDQGGKAEAAAARFRDAVQRVDPARESEALNSAVQALDSRLAVLESAREGFTPGDDKAYKVAESYAGAVDGLFDLNVALGQAANEAGLLRSLAVLTALERVKQAQGALASQAIGPTYQGVFVDQAGNRCATSVQCPSLDLAERAQSDLGLANRTFGEIATDQDRQLAASSGIVSRFDDIAGRIVSEGASTNVVSVTADQLSSSALQRLSGLEQVDTALSQRVIDQARTLEENASRAVMLYLLAGAAGMAVALAIAVVVSRSITRPLTRLTTAASRLSTEQLPALVDQLRNPDDEEAEVSAESLAEITVDSRDEIGELAEAFNTIQAVTVEVAQEQSKLLRKGIGDIFVNLARRNQSLLDRQIEFIDQLETSERDPDQLENLFRLDHLATRMRRNAESLLVMAGADPPRRRGAPLPVADVVRVAIGEVEDYQRVHLLALDDVTVAANVAADLAHLLSELMENATNASPPHTSVEVIGGYDERNGYVVSLSDRGIGMSEAQLADANALLARPPMVGLALSRSLGLTVVSRLAARHGFVVRLDSRDEGGVVATVALPYGLVEYPGEDRDLSSSPSPIEVMAAVDGRPTRTRRTASRPKPVPVPVGAPADGTEVEMAPGVLPSRVPEAAPAPVAAPEPTPAGLPRRRVSEPSAPAPTQPTALAPSAPVAPPEVTTSPAVAPAPLEAPVAPAVTSAGLTRRTPVAAQATGPAPTTPTRSASRANRSPDEVRRMLSRYRSGLDRGRTDPAADATPSNGAAADSAPTSAVTPPPTDLPEPPNRGAQE